MIASQLLIAGISTGSVYALIAIGIVLIYKSSGVVNFAQGGYAMVGAYITYALLSAGLPPTAALPLGIIALGFLGGATEYLLLRPMLRAPVVAVLMVTLGILIVMRGAVLFAFGSDTLPFPQVFPAGVVEFGGLLVTYNYIVAVLVSAGLVGIFVAFYHFTRIGLMQRCCADNRKAALAVGIHVSNQVNLSWVLSAALAGFGGILLATLSGVHETLSNIGLVAFPVIVLGGLSSLVGAFVAGLLLGVMESFTNGVLSPVLETWLRAHTEIYTVGALQQVIPYIVMVLVLLFRPHGIFGRSGTERV